MKNTWPILIVFAIILQVTAANAQTDQNGLQKGDSVKPVIIKDRLGNDVLLSAGKNSLLIIDFWNVNCSSCAIGFLKLDTMVRIFKDSVRVISVTRNSDEQAIAYFKKLKRSFPEYPVVVGDTLLSHWFPHEGDPYYVLIKDGRVLYLTALSSMTVHNIRKILKGEQVSLRQKMEMPSYQHRQGFLTNTMPMKRYSLLLAGLEDYSVGRGIFMTRDSLSGRPVYLKLSNASRLELLLHAYWKDIFGFEPAFIVRPGAQIFIDPTASELVEPDNELLRDDWARNNLLSIELRIDPDEQEELYTEFQLFLSRHLPFSVQLETKEMEAVLIEVSDSSLFSKLQVDSREGTGKITREKNFTEIKNMTINESLVRELTLNAIPAGKPPYINNTGYDGLVSMQIACHILNEQMLKKELQKLGLRLRKAIHPLQTMTIKRR